MCMWLQLQCALLYHFNTLRPRQNGRHFPDNILKCILLNENVSISIMISLKFVPKDLIYTIPGDKILSKPMMISLLIHICITQPQWVNSLCPSDATWENETWSALVKLMTYCLTALSPLNQCLLIINGSCGIPLWEISQEMLKIFILDMSTKMTNLQWHSNLPGANELILSIFTLEQMWYITRPQGHTV